MRLDWHLVYDGLACRRKYETKRCREVPLHSEQVLHPRAGQDQSVKVAEDLSTNALSVTLERHHAPRRAVLHSTKELTKSVNRLIRGEHIALEVFKEEHGSLGEPSRLTVMHLTNALDGYKLQPWGLKRM